MFNQIKEYIPLKFDSYIFYLTIGFFCAALMEINESLPYYLQLDIFYSTEISFLSIQPVSFILFIEYALVTTLVFSKQAKVNEPVNKALSDLHLKIEQLCSPAFFVMTGTSLFCFVTWCTLFHFGRGEYYKTYAINFSFLALVFLLLISISTIFLKTPSFIKARPKHKPWIMIFFISFVISPFINNDEEIVSLKIKKEKYHEIESNTQMKPEKYIENMIDKIKF
ncbi:hypothetical protein [Pseudocitrobacter faecalis]|uniref:hypothetical protein n=1 Tax=Pseudocitrobacter faecalis TaxID=1398493 RepID=UPI003BA358D8